MSIKEFLVLCLVCLAWGLHFVVMKITVEDAAEPLFYAALRMTLVALVLIPRLRWHAGSMGFIFFAGLGYGALNYAFMFPALGMTTASAAAISIELYVPFSVILSIIFLGDRIGIYRVAGICLAFLGVIIIASAKPDESAGPQFLLGIFLMVGAAMSEAVGAIMVKKVPDVSPLDLLAWFAVIGSLVLWPLSFVLETGQMQAFSPDNRYNFILALAYSAFAASLVAHSCYYWLLQRLPIYVVSTSGLMTTVVAVVSSVIILKETLSVQLVFGAGLTLLGVGTIMYSRKQRSGSEIRSLTEN
jgi:O-acetylserine/cysteine efflux transporter